MIVALEWRECVLGTLRTFAAIDKLLGRVAP